MKYILICLVIAALPYACSTAKKQPEAKDIATQTIRFDSLQKTAIDAMVGSINEGLRKIGPPQRLAFPLYNEKDTMLYWIVDNNSARISTEFNKGTEVIWPTFFVYDGDLVFVRFRYGNTDPINASARESLISLKEGTIVYCDERQKTLQPGEFPGTLMTEPHSKSKRSYAEVQADYIEYWEATKAHMEKNGVLPDFLKE